MGEDSARPEVCAMALPPNVVGVVFGAMVQLRTGKQKTWAEGKEVAGVPE